tara:strand:- start:21521 stop:21949 length:429 start_codon:yes stop_codon:yes gene_type:complete
MKKKKVIKKKPVKKLNKKAKVVIEKNTIKEFLSSRYTFDIISLVTNKDRTIKEIVFSYTGTLLIPKSLKEFHPPNKSSVTGTHVVNSKSKPILQTTDYMSISKSDMIWNLKESLRKDYILGMKEIIDNEIIPEKNIVVDLPW